ncbi:hypothetical protein [Singulisphaera sp. PoT]|uniref:hypothetical protein n=1 Tax=Singulisphaera sp. PoT TaxID=3411797 RepID=UPI003BF5A418
MIELQRLTGMRPGEVTIMRARDVDMSWNVWAYAPGRHKTQHHEKGRTIYLGPKAQEVLRPWLTPDPSAISSARGRRWRSCGASDGWPGRRR